MTAQSSTVHHNMASGYDCEFVDGPPKELHWECAICLLTLRHPYLVECCGNHFCKDCLEKISEETEKKVACPLCKYEGFRSIPNKGLERVLNERKVYCTHKKSGCEWTGELRQLDSHLNELSTSVNAGAMPSTTNLSKDQPSSPDTTDPLFKGCQFIEVRCRNCSAIVVRGQMKKHLDVCPNKPVKCKYCKSVTATPKELEEHHYPVCPKFPVACPNKCGAEIHRRNVAKHVDTTCPQSKLECEYKYVGCTCVLPRKKMESHVKSASGVAVHLSLMEKAYASLKQSKDEGKDREVLAQEVKTLRHRNADLEADYHLIGERLGRKNAALEKKVQNLSAEVCRLDAENQRLKKKLNDYYKSSYDSDSDDIDYGASYKPTSSYGHDSYSSKPTSSMLGYSAGYSSRPSHSRYSGSSSDYRSTATSDLSPYTSKPKPKKTDSSKESGMGWGTALGVLGGVAAGAVGAAMLLSRSSSSDDEKKSKKDSSWF